MADRKRKGGSGKRDGAHPLLKVAGVLAAAAAVTAGVRALRARRERDGWMRRWGK